MYAPERQSALEGIVVFSEEYGARHRKAVETLTKDQDRLLTCFDLCFTLGSSAHNEPDHLLMLTPRILAAHELPAHNN